MSKKDYIKMATQFRDAYKIAQLTDDKKIVLPYLKAIIEDFGVMLKEDNEHFNIQKWNTFIFI